MEVVSFSQRCKSQAIARGKSLLLGHLIARSSIVLVLAVSQLAGVQPVRAEPKTCEEARITFAPFEPKEFHWWTSPIQSGTLLVNGNLTARLTLNYDDRWKFIDDHKPDKYILVLSERIGLWTVGGTENPFYTFEGGSPNGFIIPARYDGKTALSTLRMPTKNFLKVTVNFEYEHPMQVPDMMLHIDCFLKSDFVKGELK
jgi:hypothetical protein